MDGVFKLSSARFVRVHNRYKSIVINIEDNRFQLRHFKPGHNGINHFCVLVGIAAFPFELGRSPAEAMQQRIGNLLVLI